MGPTARLVEVEDLEQMRSVAAHLRAAALPGLLDLVPAARTVLVSFTPSAAQDGLTALSRVLAEWSPGNAVTRSVLGDALDVLSVPTRYDGPDLGAACADLGLGPGEFAAWHTAQEWEVAFSGFAPGFGYLVAPGHTASLARLPSPRSVVPAGAVAMAGRFTGIYPRATPGGWKLVGSTDLVLFDAGAEPPAALVPGRRVRFVDVGAPG